MRGAANFWEINGCKKFCHENIVIRQNELRHIYNIKNADISCIKMCTSEIFANTLVKFTIALTAFKVYAIFNIEENKFKQML